MKVEWTSIYKLGKPMEHYLEGQYKGMDCELYRPSESAPWEWSFYDKDSPEPDLAVARGEGHATKEEATADLTDYIDGYVVEPNRATR